MVHNKLESWVIVKQKSRSLIVFAPQDVLLIAYKLLHLKDATKLDKMLKIILDHINKIRLKNPVKIREKYSKKNCQKKKIVDENFCSKKILKKKNAIFFSISRIFFRKNIPYND